MDNIQINANQKDHKAMLNACQIALQKMEKEGYLYNSNNRPEWQRK